MPWPKGKPRSEETKKTMSASTIGRMCSLEARLKISKGHTGRVPIISPYLPGNVIVRVHKGRWSCEVPDASGKRRNVKHARAVWEHNKGPVPIGMHVHHRNGDPTELEHDRIENLMLLTAEWNLRFMPVLAKGFGLPEACITEAYASTEHLPYTKRFVEVCKLLQEKYK
jgi:hypothetical protein